MTALDRAIVRLKAGNQINWSMTSFKVQAQLMRYYGGDTNFNWVKGNHTLVSLKNPAQKLVIA